MILPHQDHADFPSGIRKDRGSRVLKCRESLENQLNATPTRTAIAAHLENMELVASQELSVLVCY